MSAWIEIQIFSPFPTHIPVALYMSAWIEMQIFDGVKGEVLVALYMSAWIEIWIWYYIVCGYWSHST